MSRTVPGRDVRRPGSIHVHAPGRAAPLDTSYEGGTGMGKMLDTRHPPGVLTRTWFIKKRVVCAGWPGAPIVNTMGTYTWALVSPSIITRRAGRSGSKRQVP